MNKLFERIFWHNGTAPALNETNLNAMSKALDEIDNRVCELGAYAPETKEYAEATKQYAARVEALAGKDVYTEWHGTHEAFGLIKDQLEDGAIIHFTDDNEPLTDDYDDHLDETSINAVQNRVIKQKFDSIENAEEVTVTSTDNCSVLSWEAKKVNGITVIHTQISITDNSKPFAIYTSANMTDRTIGLFATNYGGWTYNAQSQIGLGILDNRIYCNGGVSFPYVNIDAVVC